MTFEGRWTAAVLVAGDEAVLSHVTAAMLWGIVPVAGGAVDVSVPANSNRARGLGGIRAHRRRALRAEDVTDHRGVRVTKPGLTIVDLSTQVEVGRVERAINEADVLELIDPETLRAELDRMSRRPGIAAVNALLDRYTFRLTRSELERLFIPIALRAGLPLPLTLARVNGFEVDFHWPDLALVVETDGLRYHRTAARQARDAYRDQIHLAAGITPLRYTHWQVARERGGWRRTCVP